MVACRLTRHSTRTPKGVRAFGALQLLVAGQLYVMTHEGPIVTYRCPECLCASGALHEIFCLKERCPFCGGQLASCPCIFEVLNLTPEERRVVEDYVDDSIEPLKSINERWERALEKKSRVPVQSPSVK